MTGIPPTYVIKNTMFIDCNFKFYTFHASQVTPTRIVHDKTLYLGAIHKVRTLWRVGGCTIKSVFSCTGVGGHSNSVRTLLEKIDYEYIEN